MRILGRNCGSASGGLWSVEHHSGFAPENFTTLAHFSVSSATSLTNKLGDPPIATPPSSARRVLIVGSLTTALISILSFSMLSVGAPLGRLKPNQALAS